MRRPLRGGNPRYIDDMNDFLLKQLSNILFMFDRQKKKIFRGKHDRTAAYLRKQRKRGVKIGFGSFLYLGTNIRDHRTTIGKYCSIGPNVRIGTGRHPLDCLSTSTMVHRDFFTADGLIGIDPEMRTEFDQKLPVTIGNDVWIGLNAVIMDGITVGDGAVIGAGAIVTKDVPPYAIVAGVPAKIIRYRFDEKTIERLLRTRWFDRDAAFIRTLPFGDVNKALEILENTPPPTSNPADPF